MTHHRRVPAIVILVAALLLALGYARRGTARPGTGADAASYAGLTLDQLEKRIGAGAVPPAAWEAYGGRLFDSGDFARSALAYAQAIDAQPYNRAARLRRGIALANARDHPGLLAFLREQVYAEPKLAAELFDRPELAGYLANPEFAALRADARAQAMD
ncbi:MAG TPA: hypothetical protein VIL86_13330 [Tepidisphaeraceae bacterium]